MTAPFLYRNCLSKVMVPMGSPDWVPSSVYPQTSLLITGRPPISCFYVVTFVICAPTGLRDHGQSREDRSSSSFDADNADLQVGETLRRPPVPHLHPQPGLQRAGTAHAPGWGRGTHVLKVNWVCPYGTISNSIIRSYCHLLSSRGFKGWGGGLGFAIAPKPGRTFV